MTNPTPSQRASAWLDAFGAALAKRDLDATAALFEDDCYWRDLVSFTWNICTQEGKGALRAMLETAWPMWPPATSPSKARPARPGA